MLLFLANLQAGQVGILELKVIFLLEILCHCALHSLSTLQLQRKPVWGKGKKCHGPAFSNTFLDLQPWEAPDLTSSLSNLFEHSHHS